MKLYRARVRREATITFSVSITVTVRLQRQFQSQVHPEPQAPSQSQLRDGATSRVRDVIRARACPPVGQLVLWSLVPSLCVYLALYSTAHFRPSLEPIPIQI